MPTHIVTDLDNISSLVLMPGDPLRAKYIAENFLNDAKLVNEVRNMLGYTGTYKGKRVTVIGSGMGIPSMGIYAYELAHFYNVKKIIRIGSAGALDESIKVRDVLVATEARSLSNFAYVYDGDKSHIKYGSKALIEQVKDAVSNQSVHFGPVLTSDAFDVYTGNGEMEIKELDFNPLASEMETFGLYKIGEVTGIEVLSLLTITNSKFTPLLDLTAQERQNSLNDMIKLALEAIIK